MKGDARLASIFEKLRHGIDGHPGHAGDRPHGRSLDQKGEDLGAGFEGQLIHVIIIIDKFPIASIIFMLELEFRCRVAT